MAADTLDARQHARELLDRLEPDQITAVLKLLDAMVEPEDELSDEDRRVVARSRDYFRQNPDGGISFERVVADLGFTIDEIRSHEPA